MIKDIVKDTDERPDEEICGARSGRVQRSGASVPMELGCTSLPACGYLHQPERLSTFVVPVFI